MKLHRYLATVLMVFSMSSAWAVDRARAVEELAAARVKWAASGVTSYEIRFEDQNCFCLYGPYYGPIRNVVRAGKLRESYYEGERMDGYWFGRRVRIATDLRATVEDAFARAERLVTTAPEGTFRAEYDPIYGYPAVLAFDDPARDDEQWRLVASAFRPARKGR